MNPVFVIGAGLVGLATAFELQQRGHDVTVIDPAPASQATHYAGGMLAPVAEVQYGQEALYPLMLTSAGLYPDLMERLAAATDLPTGHRTAGTLVVAADRADADNLRDLVDHQRRNEMDVDKLTVRQARQLEPSLSPSLAGAVHIPGDHEIAPRAMATALIDALTRGGATFVRENVTELKTDHGNVSEIIGRTFATQAKDATVVLCNGLGAAQVSGWYRGTHPLKLRPVFGDILIVRTDSDQPEVLTRVVRGFVGGRPIYLIPRDDHQIAIGATSREDPRELTPAGAVHDLLRDAITVCPAIEEAGLVEFGTGARPGTPDDLPYLGKVADNLIISTGYFRHGILLSALAARVTADLAGSGRTEYDDILVACHPLRHH